jgi:hypothetical protein
VTQQSQVAHQLAAVVEQEAVHVPVTAYVRRLQHIQMDSCVDLITAT